MSDEGDWIAAGLFDPAAADAEDRRDLLAYLDSIGVTVEEMVEADAGRGLGTAASDHVLDPPGNLTLAELAATAGVTVDQAKRAILAAGFALPGDDERAYGQADAEVIEVFSAGAAMLGETTVLQLLRVIGSSLARIAEAADAAFLQTVEKPHREVRGRAVDLARSAHDGTAMLLDLPVVMAPIFRRHVAAAIQRSRAARGEGRVDRFLLAVGFADLVGSTQLATVVGPASLGGALADLEREAADRATSAGGRLVKSIGDEVMIVGPDPAAVVDVIGHLVSFAAAHPVLTAVRAAVAFGDVVAQGGDYFGPVVNLAARAVKEAEPGQVVVTDAVAAALATAGITTSQLGVRSLRGFDEPVALHLVIC